MSSFQFSSKGKSMIYSFCFFSHLSYSLSSLSFNASTKFCTAKRSCIGTRSILEKRPLDSTAIFIFFFSVVSRFPLKTVHPFRNFLAVLPPPPYTKLRTRKKNSGHTRPTLFVGLDLCELENAPEIQYAWIDPGTERGEIPFLSKNPSCIADIRKRKARGQVPQLLCLTIILTYFMFNFYLQHPPHTPTTPSPTDSIRGGTHVFGDPFPNTRQATKILYGLVKICKITLIGLFSLWCFAFPM